MTLARIDAGDAELAVSDSGAGPAVLLVHGFPDSHRLWRHQVPALNAAGYRTIAPDMTGCGASDKPADVSRYTVGRLVADLVAVLDGLGVARAHVVGHDWGAALAWPLAALHPDRVATLTALSVGHPSAFAGAGWGQRARSWYTQLFQVRGLAEWILARRTLAGHPEPEEVRSRLHDRPSIAAALGPYRANMALTVLLRRARGDAARLPHITAPTLAVWSSGDRYLTERSMVGSRRYVDGSWRYERLDDVGHWIPLEAPDRLNRLLLDFLPRG